MSYLKRGNVKLVSHGNPIKNFVEKLEFVLKIDLFLHSIKPPNAGKGSSPS